jgi:aryl-alcohol dehydrogenase-like predicted oxidoreductase
MLVGGWQLSHGHRQGALDEERIQDDLLAMARAGLTTFDCADIYTGVEEAFGRFAARSGRDLERDGIELQFHTKYVPDQDALSSLTKPDVERTIDRSLRRLGVERLDLVQFAWWNYDVPGYVEAALWLTELQRAGKIRHLGITNFDVPRTREMLDAGVPLVCNQVQYSLLDRRPERGMVRLAEARGLGLLCYGTLAGGFLSERYAGVQQPEGDLGTRSLTKYRLIIDEFGGWERFQVLLEVLGKIATRHAVRIPCVAMRWVLDRPLALGVIVGTYHASHLAPNLAACDLVLDEADQRSIEEVLRRSRGPEGEVFGLERIAGGPHASIMWRNLSSES